MKRRWIKYSRRSVESNEAVQLGLFKDIADPDLVLIFCNPGTADILNRAYTYVSGEPVSGFGGNGACPFAIQYPYVTKKPSFTYSDVSWRKYVGMTDDELTMSFPFQSLVQFIEYLPAVAEEYRHYGEMPGAIGCSGDAFVIRCNVIAGSSLRMMITDVFQREQVRRAKNAS